MLVKRMLNQYVLVFQYSNTVLYNTHLYQLSERDFIAKQVS